MRAAAGVWVVAAAVCIACTGCHPRARPVVEEQAILSRILGIPPDRLLYEGTVSDLPGRGARCWAIATSAEGKQLAGRVFTQFSCLQQYTAFACGSLPPQCPLRTRISPVTVESATVGAKQLACRFWGVAPSDMDAQGTRIGTKMLGDRKVGSYIGVELRLPRRQRHAPRHAYLSFDGDTGICDRVYARFDTPPRR